jgi:hypothetical protein
VLFIRQALFQTLLVSINLIISHGNLLYKWRNCVKITYLVEHECWVAETEFLARVPGSRDWALKPPACGARGALRSGKLKICTHAWGLKGHSSTPYTPAGTLQPRLPGKYTGSHGHMAPERICHTIHILLLGKREITRFPVTGICPGLPLPPSAWQQGHLLPQNTYATIIYHLLVSYHLVSSPVWVAFPP